MTDQEQWQLLACLTEAFRPGSPIDQKRLFAGRSEQTRMIVNAVLQTGQHVILYGERGVGKTSLARVLTELLSVANIIKTVNSYTINCDATDTFPSLWHKAFKELTWKIAVTTGHFDSSDEMTEVNLDRLIPANVTPEDVRRALSTVKESVVIVFDEFDQVQDKQAKTLMAHTIKTLSDHSINTTVVIVGVAEAVTDLIAEHQSIDRALVEVPMPRMSQEELGEIISKGLGQCQIKMADTVRSKIVRLSHGLPHFTHLLALESGRCAVERRAGIIEDTDFSGALKQIVKTKFTVASDYHSAVSSSYKNSRHKVMLLACALSRMDDHGYFQASGVAEILSKLDRKPHVVSDVQKHLTEFISDKRGSVLCRFGKVRRYKYRFSNPLVQPYTIIHSLSEGLISESDLWLMDQPFFGNR